MMDKSRRQYFILACHWLAGSRYDFVMLHLNFGKSRVMATKARAVVAYDRRLASEESKCGVYDGLL